MNKLRLDTAEMRKHLATLRAEVGDAARWRGYARGLASRPVDGMRPGTRQSVIGACEALEDALGAMIEEVGPHIRELERRRRRLEGIEAETASYRRAADRLNHDGALGVKWGFWRATAAETGRGFADVMVLDDVRTLKDDDASWGAKAWAGFNLATTIVPVGKLTKAGKLLQRGGHAVSSTRTGGAAVRGAQRVPGVTRTARGARAAATSVRGFASSRWAGALAAATMTAPGRLAMDALQATFSTFHRIRGVAYDAGARTRVGWEAARVRAIAQRLNSNVSQRLGLHRRPSPSLGPFTNWQARLGADPQVGDGLRAVLGLPLRGGERLGRFTHPSLTKIADVRARWPAFQQDLLHRGALRHEFVDKRNGLMYREYVLRDPVGVLPNGRPTRVVTVVLGTSTHRGGYLPKDIRLGSVEPVPGLVRETVGPLFLAGVYDDMATVRDRWTAE